MAANSPWIPLIAIIVLLAAFVYQQISTNPKAALLLFNFLNRFDDQYNFNLHENQFLLGVFAPSNKELNDIKLEVVEGAIPSDFSGLFLRIGPNPLPGKTHNDRGYHWFDGHGMIHAIRVKDGEAHYSNQWVNTHSYHLSKEYNQSIFIQIGEIRGFVGLLKAILLPKAMGKSFKVTRYHEGEANTAFLFYKNRLFACHEGSLPYEIQWQANNTLQSVGYEDFNGTLNYPFTAHGKVDPVDGGLYFDGYNIEPTAASFKYGKIRDNQVEAYFEVPTASRSFSHDMMITENYVLIFESSVVFDITRIIAGDMFHFEEANPLRIGVVSKKAKSNDEVRWFTFQRPYSIIHALNAWEEGNEIKLFTPIGFEFNGLDPKNKTVSNGFHLAELTINLETESTDVDFFPTKEIIEFPNVHPKYLGRKSQYGFTGEFAQNRLVFKNIVKFDLFQKTVAAKIQLPEGWYSGEPVLIPKQGPAGEASDGVYIAAIVYHEETSRSQWFLYDGETMDSTPLVRLEHKDVRVPMGFHGIFLNEEQFQAHIQQKK